MRNRITSSTLAAATAVVVSFASLYIAWRQNSLMERQLAASVWPVVEFTNGNEAEHKEMVHLGLRNGGLGPARIRAFELSYQGKPLTSWWQLLAACCGWKESDSGKVLSSQILGRILAAGQSFSFLSLERAENEELWKKLDQARFHLAGHICYCSVLDQCWSLDINEVEPVPVTSCTAVARRPQYNSY
jgi:hypothetical protein